MDHRPLSLLYVGLALLAALPASLSGLATVFGPDVTAGDDSFEARVAYGSESERWGYRVHYQHAWNGAWRSRIVGVASEADGEDVEYRYTRLETQWQFAEDEIDGWDGAFRLDLQAADGDNLPHQVRLVFTGQRKFFDWMLLRSNLFTGRTVGAQSHDGWIVQGRLEVAAVVADGITIGLDYFANLNHTEAFRSFDEQRHQLGPTIRARLPAGFVAHVIVLGGLSEAAEDLEARLGFGYGF